MGVKPKVQRVIRVRSSASDTPPFRTLCFRTHGGGRYRCPDDFIDAQRIPEFDGEEAWFLMVKEREPGCPWPRWKVLQRVNPDGSPFGA